MAIVRFSQPKEDRSTSSPTLTFASPTAEIVARKHPFRERSVLYTLTLLLAVIGVFVSVVKLDRVVTAKGRIVPTGGALTVQPLDKSIISRVLVSVGDQVKKGQTLAVCDPTFVKADLTSLREKVSSLDAEKRRMEYEEVGGAFQPDPSKPADMLQSTIRHQRYTEFVAGLNDFDERIRGSEVQIAGFKESIQDLNGRLAIAKETENMYTVMEHEGIATRLDLIGMQDKTLDMENQLSQQQNLLDAGQHTLESLKEQRKVYVDKWHDDNLDKLAGVRDDYEQAVNDLTKQQKMNDLVDLVAPVDAIVLKVPDLSVGGVAVDAEPLFSLMPIDAPVEIDAQVDSHDSGFVRTGDKVTIKFDTYKFLEHGTGDGVVRTISEDAFTEVDDQDTVTKGADRQSRPPYFDTRITVKKLHLHDVPPDARLIPGMTLEADIIVGRRTILWYLFGGALRSGADAMREP
jgi:hemolysin D